MRTAYCWAAAMLLVASIPLSGEAKSYSSGGHSYSSSSRSSSSGRSHSSSPSGGSSHKSALSGSAGGGSHNSRSNGSRSPAFRSGSGKSYSSGSTSSDEGRHSYTASKSYTSGAGHKFTSESSPGWTDSAPEKIRSTESDKSSPRLSFDTAAARARKEEASQREFARFKQSQVPPKIADGTTSSRSMPLETRSSGSGPTVPPADAASYRVNPPPIPVSRSYQRDVYIPDWGTLSSRPSRIVNVFNSYSTRPYVTYHDPYSSLFWWWLLDRSFEDRAWWAYHHRYDMDPARYQALIASDQRLEQRVEQLEAEQAPRDPRYVPAGLDRDLMYSDRYLQHAFSNRPTASGVVAFWVLGVPLALAVLGFFIWLIWFKRWQTST